MADNYNEVRQMSLLRTAAFVCIDAGMTFQESVQLFRKQLTEVAIVRNGGNRVGASRMLHVHRNTVRRNLSVG